jgi:hypothetical protein
MNPLRRRFLRENADANKQINHRLSKKSKNAAPRAP